MTTTIEDVQYEMHLQEEWEKERREALKALEKIANSENIFRLQKNLNKLKNIYSSEIAINDDNVKKLISELDFSMPKIKEYFDKRDKKTEETNKKHFYITIFSTIVATIIGLVLGYFIF